MNGWVEDALRDAIDFLAKSRRNDLASDLNRILKAVNFDDLEIMRSSAADQIAGEIVESETIAELTDTLKRMARMMNFGHCTLLLVAENSSANFTTKVITTYPEEWINLYVNRRYYFVDPVVQASKTRVQSFYWDSLPSSGTVVRSFWSEAEAHGVGSSGYTLPITTERGDMLALSISSMQGVESFRETLAFHESDLFNLGVFLAEAFCRLAAEHRPASYNPTDEQLLVLQAISRGVEEADLEGWAYQYGSYSTLRRSICSLFHTKTLAQAAVLAARIGLLDNAPLTKADILAASEKVACGLVAPSSVASLRRLVSGRNLAMPTETGVLMAV